MSIHHKHGGTITAVHGIGHSTYQGAAEWYFVGDIEWEDGSTSERREISPILFRHAEDDDEARRAIDRLMGQLTTYLQTHGTWHEPKRIRGGRYVSWTPHEKTGYQPLEAIA